MSWLKQIFAPDGLYIYTWEPRPETPQGPRPRGSFSVDKVKVRTGEVAWVDVKDVYFIVPLLVGEEFERFDFGLFKVDERTGFVHSGSFHSTSRGDHGAVFGHLFIRDDNIFGRSYYGRWVVTFEFNQHA